MFHFSTVAFKKLSGFLHSLHQLNPFATSPQPTSAKEIGTWGERKAAQFLKRERQFHIVCRNWRQGKAEIDLVAWDKEVLVFVEVRTRRDSACISGYYSINRKKIQSLKRAFRAYLAHLKPPPQHFRCDIVEVQLGERGNCNIQHYENIPLFDKYYFPPQ